MSESNALKYPKYLLSIKPVVSSGKEMVFVMNDQTAYWLLSSLLQAMATIWGLFMIVFFFYIDRYSSTYIVINGDKKKNMSRKNFIGKTFLWFNTIIILSIIFCIFGLVFFRNDTLLFLSVISSIIAILIIGIFLRSLLKSVFLTKE